MKKYGIIFASLIIVVIIILSFFIYNKQNNVTMRIKKGTLTNTGATIIIINNGQRVYKYNNDFEIYKKEKNKWKKIELKEGKQHEVDTIAMSSKDKTIEFNIDWSDLYGILEKGKYKLVKKNEVNGKEKNLSVKFNIK